MGPISWIIFGGLAGWVASLIAGTNNRQGCLLNIIVGIVGALIGGALYGFFVGGAFTFGWNPVSFVVAVIGALILLAIVGAARGNQRR
ncbi:MAG: GlsB/YeaQ/YmgE family stress response membrane protein [Oscillochloris sp.]|nr:GlsB/YeaQ/YmgE family stress response membrane protein [Oscillochloris sp.]